jgi:hypothetical protein
VTVAMVVDAAAQTVVAAQSLHDLSDLTLEELAQIEIT